MLSAERVFAACLLLFQAFPGPHLSGVLLLWLSSVLHGDAKYACFVRCNSCLYLQLECFIKWHLLNSLGLSQALAGESSNTINKLRCLIPGLWGMNVLTALSAKVGFDVFIRDAVLWCKLHLCYHSLFSGHETCPIEDTICSLEIWCCTCWCAWSRTVEVRTVQLEYTIRCIQGTSSLGYSRYFLLQSPCKRHVSLSGCTEKSSSKHLGRLYTQLNTMPCHWSNICCILSGKNTITKHLCTILCSPAQLVCQFWQDVLC